MARPPMTPEKFWDTTIPEPNSGCLLWLGAKNPGGYGSLRDWVFRSGRHSTAHRFAYQLTYGPAPDDLFVCHKCDTKLCVNPKHLFLGTPKDNTDDRDRKGRFVPLRNEKNGHCKISSENVVEIRRLADMGVNQYEIAKKFGTSQANVSRLFRREARIYV